MARGRCDKRKGVARGRVWQEGGCGGGKREGVARGRVWQEEGCGKREGVEIGVGP